MIDTARSVLKSELQARFFDNRPSNARMVLCFMSKQMPCKQYFTPAQLILSETLYKGALRDAVQLVAFDATSKTRTSPQKKAKFAKPVEPSSMLFRGAFEEDEETTTAADQGDFDVIIDEIKRWGFVTPDELKEFRCSDGLLNEFKMMWRLRHRFPLHYVVFKQLACHLPHEANVEQYFSRAGNLSDPNMNPACLGVLVKVGCNKKRFKPAVKAVLERYYAKHRGQGGEGFEEEAGPSSHAPAPAPAPAPASAPAPAPAHSLY